MLKREVTAGDYLGDLLCDILIYRKGLTSARQVAASLPDGLQLSVEFIEGAMADSPRFVGLEHSYDLAYRPRIANKALGGAVADILEAFGKPMPKPLIVGELLAAGKGDLQACQEAVDSMLARDKLMQVDEQFVYMADWLFVPMPGTDRQRLVYLNALDSDEDLAEVMDVCTEDKLGSRSLTDTAEAVLKAAQRPLSNKALGFLVGCHQGDRYNPEDLLRQTVHDDQERFVCIYGPRWILAEWLETLHKYLRRKAPPDEQPDQTVDMAGVLAKEVAAEKRHELSAEDTERVFALAHAARSPVSIEQVLADVLELTPNQRKYAPAAQAVQQWVAGQSNLRTLHGGRFLHTAAIPTRVRAVPDALLPENWKPELDRDGRLSSENVLLKPEGLEPEALDAASDPFYDDIGEPYVAAHEQLKAESETVNCPLLYHHYLAGTLRLRASDMHLFAEEAGLTMIDVRVSDGKILGVWLNQDTGLLYGWEPWYHVHLPPSGALISLRKTQIAGHYLLHCADETDAQTYIGRETLDHLLELREHFSHTPASLKRIAAMLLPEDKGLGFNQLWAQLNVIRRTTRAQLASVLSFYLCFEHGEGNRWYFHKDRLADGYREERLEHVVGLKRPASKPAEAGD